MTRPPRPAQYEGAIFHVTNRGNAGCVIYRDDADCGVFLDSLLRIKKRTPFDLLAFCLMSNHFHLLIRLVTHGLSIVMQRLELSYTRRFHDRWQTGGHLLQGRFWAGPCRTEPYFLELVRYIHLNPIRAGLVNEPSEWPWSSHHDFVGRPRVAGLVNVAETLSHFGRGVAGQAEYVAFVGAGMNGEGTDFEPVLFQEDDPALDRVAGVERQRESLASIVQRATFRFGFNIGELASRIQGEKYAAARRYIVLEANREGHRNGEIAALLNRTEQAISNILYRPSRGVGVRSDPEL